MRPTSQIVMAIDSQILSLLGQVARKYIRMNLEKCCLAQDNNPTVNSVSLLCCSAISLLLPVSPRPIAPVNQWHGTHHPSSAIHINPPILPTSSAITIRLQHPHLLYGVNRKPPFVSITDPETFQSLITYR